VRLVLCLVVSVTACHSSDGSLDGVTLEPIRSAFWYYPYPEDTSYLSIQASSFPDGCAGQTRRLKKMTQLLERLLPESESLEINRALAEFYERDAGWSLSANLDDAGISVDEGFYAGRLGTVGFRFTKWLGEGRARYPLAAGYFDLEAVGDTTIRGDIRVSLFDGQSAKIGGLSVSTTASYCGTIQPALQALDEASQ
jgi:hypothetical protein